MTNPDAPDSAKFLALTMTNPTFSRLQWTTAWVVGLALGAGSLTTHAQSLEALEWQPGQSSVPLVISTPHNDVRKLLRQAKYPQALVLVNKALTTNPRDPQMRFWQGFVYEQLGQPDMALQIYLDLTRDYPELAEPFNNLGVLYAAKGDYHNAKTALDSAVRANPNYPAAHENLGDLLIHMAQQSYEKSRQLDPKQNSISQKIQRLKPVLEITQGKP